ncbi:hypothetical protein [Alkalilimnicola sp. S0819]|uniref:hypothetical protein n=1 Tax=Alkalilimnicola sp. S0819 TaxID=2613922 RepID=UPI001261D659|nr:hypothetical protein [Alkalilimnicola sp. S0819]KAB7623409.1 hypothetical protein F3N43_09945 [Alkalilimnicola sp. S0819]MPQ16955.1 hypothetical protein [Alkalilimnicola sp. S0819]
MRYPSRCALALMLLCGAVPSFADEDQAHVIETTPDKAVHASFDIVRSRMTTEGNVAVFHMEVSGQAGESRPAPSGKLAGSDVFSYVWPTSIDPAVVGFEPEAGILAFAVTAHPDFDDTPWFDENGDGDLNNDGNIWHSHWVVLAPDDACGKDALKVVDIPEGAKPRLPKTWPGLPILIDSPGWSPVMDGATVEVRVPFDDIGEVADGSFDGVAAALRVNASVHAPLLCVVDVFKVASGDLSLPGKVGSPEPGKAGADSARPRR